MNPKVSVIMATYNRDRYIRESLDSIFAQTLPPHQVIVVNDGSTDDTRQVLEPFMNRIVYLEQENCGKSVALNHAMVHVTGDYVWTFDDDDVMLPNGLEALVDVLERNPDIGFSYGTYWRARADSEGALRPTRFWDTPEFDESEKFTRLMEYHFMPPQIMVRTSCYRVVGPFDPEILRLVDYEMVLRLARRFRSARIPTLIYYLRVHDGVRGTASSPIPARDIPAKWLEYRKKIFRRLRQELPLQDYLPKGCTDLKPDISATRRAYLQRMTIMSAKGLFEEMTEDLELAIEADSIPNPLSHKEKELLWRSIKYPDSRDELFTDPGYFRRIRMMCGTAGGRQLRRELGCCLLRRIRLEIGRRRPGNTWRVSLAALRFMGPVEFIRMMASDGRSSGIGVARNL
jgi:glycosyltransferase involved in cell wall biosynthesis